MVVINHYWIGEILIYRGDPEDCRWMCREVFLSNEFLKEIDSDYCISNGNKYRVITGIFCILLKAYMGLQDINVA